jgi:hypothetical protein
MRRTELHGRLTGEGLRRAFALSHFFAKISCENVQKYTKITAKIGKFIKKTIDLRKKYNFAYFAKILVEK